MKREFKDFCKVTFNRLLGYPYFSSLSTECFLCPILKCIRPQICWPKKHELKDIMVTTAYEPSHTDGTAAYANNSSVDELSHHDIYSAGGTSASASVSASTKNKYECNNDIIPNAPTYTSLQNECSKSQSSTANGTKSWLYCDDEDEGGNNNTKVGRIGLKRG